MMQMVSSSACHHLFLEGHANGVIVGPVIRLGAENNSEIVFEPRSKLDTGCPGV
jgi:hypothetical protein